MSWPKVSRPPLHLRNGIEEFVEDEVYVGAFGTQWINWARTKLDSHTGLPITRIRMQRIMGPLWDELFGKQVLEAGCGAGRFTELLLEQGAIVTAIDLSVAVDANKTNHGSNSNFRVFRASILDLPFAENQFDIVFCPGVIQHTPNSKKTIEALWHQVKPGGWLAFDHYRHNWSTWTRTSWMFRLFLRKLSPAKGTKATNWLVDRLLPLHKKVARFRPAEILLNRISPITSHYAGYPLMSESDQIDWARLNTHDNLTDYYKHHITVRKLNSILVGLGATEISCGVMPYTVEIRCRKPFS